MHYREHETVTNCWLTWYVICLWCMNETRNEQKTKAGTRSSWEMKLICMYTYTTQTLNNGSCSQQHAKRLLLLLFFECDSYTSSLFVYCTDVWQQVNTLQKINNKNISSIVYNNNSCAYMQTVCDLVSFVSFVWQKLLVVDISRTHSSRVS